MKTSTELHRVEVGPEGGCTLVLPNNPEHPVDAYDWTGGFIDAVCQGDGCDWEWHGNVFPKDHIGRLSCMHPVMHRKGNVCGACDWEFVRSPDSKGES